MPENSENRVPGNSSASTNASAAGKSTPGKKKSATKKIYGKMTFRLPLELQQALTLSSVQLQIAGEERYTEQEQVEHAVERFTDFLQVKKGIEFLGVIPKKPEPPKTANS